MTTDNTEREELGANGHTHRFGIISVPPEYGHSYLRCVTCLLSKHLADHDPATCDICARSRAVVAAPQGDELSAFMHKVAALKCARVDGDECCFFEKEVLNYCASCHARELIERLSPVAPSLIAEQEPRLLTAEELADIERFQRQRRKSPVASDAWLYVAEIDRLLTHIRLEREQLENEIFQDATDPNLAVTPSTATAAEHDPQWHIDEFWKMLDRCWEIEPREYFEREAPRNGFGSPLAMAVHYMWKREVKEAATSGAREAAESAAREVIDAVWGEAKKLADSFVKANIRNYNDHKGVESLERVYDAKCDTAQQIFNQMHSFNEARWKKPDDIVAIILKHFPSAVPVEEGDKDRTQCASCQHPFCKKCYEVGECCECDTDIPSRTVAERLAQHDHIDVVHGVLGGVNPLVSRTRISVHHILSYLYNGNSIEYIAETYNLSPEAVKDAIAFAQDVYDDAINISSVRRPVS